MADDSIAGYDITNDFNSPSLADTSYTSGTGAVTSGTGAVYDLNDTNYGSPVTPVVLSDGTTIYAKSDGSYIDGNGNPVTSGGSVIADETAPVKEVKLPNGSTIYQKSNGSYTDGNGNAVNSDGTSASDILNQLKNAFGSAIYKKDAAGNLTNQLDLSKLGSLALGGYSAYQAANYQAPKSGYQGGIPSLAAVRTQLPQQARTPYTGQPAMGRRYFTDTQYVAPAQAEATRAAQQQAVQPVQAAQGGLMAAKGTYLRGATDGMADELDTSIEGKQPAKLSHGEFVVPADVVSHLGNGNSDAGAKKLYQMMDRIRVARTGTKQQGKEINPDKFMPGGKVGYAQGGLATFAEGGVSTAPSGAALSSGLTGTESSLSNWAGPYVTNMLGQGQALANQPYQAYSGQLTAGTSPLQQQAFQGAQGLATPANMGGFNPQSFTSQGTAQQYMNPYLQQALDPQLAEARRQSQITQTQNAGKLTGAGAYGGGRQAIMDSETQRNLATNLADITGRGYMNAYDKAMQQFNTEQQAAQQAQNLTNQYGLNVLGQQAGLGQAQRGIESEAVAADRAQFEEERLNPYKMVQFQQSLLSGLPLAAQTYNQTAPNPLLSALSSTGSGYDLLNKILGGTTATPAKSPGQT